MIRKIVSIKYLTVSFIALMSLGTYGFGQKEGLPSHSKRPFSDRVFFGGSLGFSFGSFSSVMDISPIVGYSITDDFMAGIGLTYKYYKYRNYYMNVNDRSLSDLKLNMYGGSVWSRYFLSRTGVPIIENMFLHTEIEPLFLTNEYKFSPDGDFINPFGSPYKKEKEKINLMGIFAGGGIRQPVGGRSFMYLEVLWNLNEELYSPYSNPRIRIGFAAGF
jgi:hypothetical protein